MFFFGILGGLYGGVVLGGFYGQLFLSFYGVQQFGFYGQGGIFFNVDFEVYFWFQLVDLDYSGYIFMKELKQVLVNCNWFLFNDEICFMMINMFDKIKLGCIDVYGFLVLWKFIQQWKNFFQQYDWDCLGFISYIELQ